MTAPASYQIGLRRFAARRPSGFAARRYLRLDARDRARERRRENDAALTVLGKLPTYPAFVAAMATQDTRRVSGPRTARDGEAHEA